MAVIDGCSNLLGPQLGEGVKTRLQELLANPCQETWESAHPIIITASGTTMWQAVMAVDPDFPRSKSWEEPWPKIPDQLTLYRAIRHATAGR